MVQLSAPARQQTFEPNAEVSVKYFTSADRPNPEKIADRQVPIWWEALRLIGCDIIEGEFRLIGEEVEAHLRSSSRRWREKKTDVALASHMVKDCSRIESGDRPGTLLWSPGYDRAVLLTGDTDFIPTVRIVSQAPFDRTVMVLLPPSGSASQENAKRAWDQARSRKVVIKQLQLTGLAKALLPRVVEGPEGRNVVCHGSWMWRERHEAEIARRKKSPIWELPNLPRTITPSKSGGSRH
jgi:hypothetical protein